MFYEKIDFICLYYCLFIVLERFNLNFLAKYGNRDFEIVILSFFSLLFKCDHAHVVIVGDIERLEILNGLPMAVCRCALNFLKFI